MGFYSPEDLSRIEREILEIIWDLRKNRKLFNMKFILKICQSRLTYTELEISSSLKALYDKNILIEGIQLTSSEILNNPNRNLIYSTINEQPGIHLRELTGKTDLPLHTICWHLMILKKFNFIKSIKFKNYFCFGNVDIPDNLLIKHHVLRNELNTKIIYELVQEPKIKLSDLSKKLNTSRSTIQYHIRELENAGIIAKMQKETSES